MIGRILFLILLVFAAPALGQTFPDLTGQVVDQANLLPPDQEAALTQRLEALEQASTRQLVVVTVPDLQGYEVEEYGYRLGRHWGIGQSEANNGVILLIALQERKIRIEVGYGLEGIMTDALSSQIINREIRPRFKDGDFPGGIVAGADAIIEQLQAPPEAAEQRALDAAQAERGGSRTTASIIPLVFWILILFFVLVPMLKSGFKGRRYRGRRRGGPIVIWGPGMGGGWSRGSSGSSSGSGWGGWSSGGGGSSWGGGGFSGGGGSFGGGGASGGW